MCMHRTWVNCQLCGCHSPVQMLIRGFQPISWFVNRLIFFYQRFECSGWAYLELMIEFDGFGARF